MLRRDVGDVHQQRHAVAARREDGRVVDGAHVLCARVPLVLDAVQRLRRLAAEHVDAAVDRPVVARFLLAAVARRVEDGRDEQRAVAGIAQVLHVRVEGVASVGHARVRLQHVPRIRLDQTQTVTVAAFEVSDGQAPPRKTRVKTKVTLTRVQVNLSQQGLRGHVIQFENVVGPGLHRAPCGGYVRHLNDAFGFVRTQSSRQDLVDELYALLAEDAHEFIASDVQQAELRRRVAGEVQGHETVAKTQDALDPEVVDGRQLRGDVVVLEVLGHLRELAALAETEEGRALVDVDDALAAHAERVAAVLVDRAVAQQNRLSETRRICNATDVTSL